MPNWTSLLWQLTCRCYFILSFFYIKKYLYLILMSCVGKGNSVQFSRSVVSDSLWPHELQHTRPLCLPPTPRVHPNPCPLSWWWTERPGVLQFMGSQRVGHNWATELTDILKLYLFVEICIVPIPCCIIRKIMNIFTKKYFWVLTVLCTLGLAWHIQQDNHSSILKNQSKTLFGEVFLLKLMSSFQF